VRHRRAPWLWQHQLKALYCKRANISTIMYMQPGVVNLSFYISERSYLTCIIIFVKKMFCPPVIPGLPLLLDQITVEVRV
jgi:hypothetical protein